jgi:hypothetical protein
MDCPKCGQTQTDGAVECMSCGVILAKARGADAPAAPRTPPSSGDSVLAGILGSAFLVIEQHARHWWEILLNWEQRNEYAVRDPSGATVGFVVEQGKGFLAAVVRCFMGSHRPLDVAVFDTREQLLLQLERTFFWFFSSLDVKTPDGQRQGKVERRFGIITKRYDLHDERGRVFATIASPFWRIWTFPILDGSGRQVGEISKKWSGLGKELFTDADNFKVDFGEGRWTPGQRTVLFAAALSIDFDFFENNSGNSGGGASFGS